jgi:rhamnulose-1-phosphate aldolase/alcohol dehydrogenase
VETQSKFAFVKHLWKPEEAKKLDPVSQLIYRSNILGSDPRITNTRGGNTSAKIRELDPLTGAQTDVLWVKGSGGDLRTAKQQNFSSLYQEKLLGLEKVYAGADKRGVKSPVEDRMVGMYTHCTFNANPCPTSIDTPLHSFIPHAHVDHMHPMAVITLAAAADSKDLVKKVYGDDVIWTAWQRPGFDLALKFRDICKEFPKAKGIVMGHHGLISWADDGEACYENTLELIERAARYIADHDKGAKTFGGVQFATLPEAERKKAFASLLPWLRGQVSAKKRLIATYHDDAAIQRFAGSVDAPKLTELGSSCPDHFLRTKIKPLYVPFVPGQDDLAALKQKAADGMKQYRLDYAAYYEKCKEPSSPAMRDQNPTVVIIPGLGMISFGKDKMESRVTGEFYLGAIEVMRGAEALSSYTALPLKEAFDVEYWLLEEAKLKLMPPEKELSRKVVAIIGAGSGIGRELALRVAKEGAQVVCVDMNAEAARAVAKEVDAACGPDMGACGSGVSACGYALGLGANITDRASVAAAIEEMVLAYGGVDAMAVTAGIFVPPDTAGRIPDDKWALSYAINVTGLFYCADEMSQVWKEQGLNATLVLTTSANAVVAKKGSLAYDTSKAAANHLVRELAIELSPLVRVNGVAPATVVQGSLMFPRDRVIASLAKYKLPYKDDESSEALTTRLAQFYADRTLTKSPITPQDQAEAIFLLLGDRLSKTTGQIIHVDGGLSDAFLR